MKLRNDIKWAGAHLNSSLFWIETENTDRKNEGMAKTSTLVNRYVLSYMCLLIIERKDSDSLWNKQNAFSNSTYDLKTFCWIYIFGALPKKTEFKASYFSTKLKRNWSWYEGEYQLTWENKPVYDLILDWLKFGEIRWFIASFSKQTVPISCLCLCRCQSMWIFVETLDALFLNTETNFITFLHLISRSQ